MTCIVILHVICLTKFWIEYWIESFFKHYSTFNRIFDVYRPVLLPPNTCSTFLHYFPPILCSWHLNPYIFISCLSVSFPRYCHTPAQNTHAQYNLAHCHILGIFPNFDHQNVHLLYSEYQTVKSKLKSKETLSCRWILCCWICFV